MQVSKLFVEPYLKLQLSCSFLELVEKEHYHSLVPNFIGPFTQNNRGLDCK